MVNGIRLVAALETVRQDELLFEDFEAAYSTKAPDLNYLNVNNPSIHALDSHIFAIATMKARLRNSSYGAKVLPWLTGAELQGN